MPTQATRKAYSRQRVAPERFRRRSHRASARRIAAPIDTRVARPASDLSHQSQSIARAPADSPAADERDDLDLVAPVQRQVVLVRAREAPVQFDGDLLGLKVVGLDERA